MGMGNGVLRTVLAVLIGSSLFLSPAEHGSKSTIRGSEHPAAMLSNPPDPVQPTPCLAADVDIADIPGSHPHIEDLKEVTFLRSVRPVKDTASRPMDKKLQEAIDCLERPFISAVVEFRATFRELFPDRHVPKFPKLLEEQLEAIELLRQETSRPWYESPTTGVVLTDDELIRTRIIATMLFAQASHDLHIDVKLGVHEGPAWTALDMFWDSQIMRRQNGSFDRESIQAERMRLLIKMSSMVVGADHRLKDRQLALRGSLRESPQVPSEIPELDPKYLIGSAETSMLLGALESSRILSIIERAPIRMLTLLR